METHSPIQNIIDREETDLFAAKAQRTDWHLVRESEAEKLLIFRMFLTIFLIPNSLKEKGR
jgi:hypothetical protein